MSFAIPLSARAETLLLLKAEGVIPAAQTMGDAAIAAVNDALDREETHYTDRPGILPLRQRVADHLTGRFGLALNAKSDVVVTCGVTEARFVAVQQLCKPGDKVFSAAPDKIAGAAELRGAGLAQTPAGAVLVHITGSMGEDAIRQAIAKAGSTATVLFEIDDDDSRFHPAMIEGLAGRTVTIGGVLGDGALASASVGYLAGQFQSAALRDFKQALTICTTNLSQWAALAAWQA
jgi:aspartate/methionine/tyrosine aminotransferase